MKKPCIALILAVCACRAEQPANDLAAAEPTSVATNGLVAPATPGSPGGLPDDRTPISEGAIDPNSPQGAGQVLQQYFALAEQGRFADAYRLWSDGGRATGESEAGFIASFRQYREIHAEIGAPGQPEGAAGSIYVRIPVQLYGRLADGQPFRASGSMTLRRVNDVPGATPEQLQWRIFKSEMNSAR